MLAVSEGSTCHVNSATLMALMGSNPCKLPAEKAEHAIPIHYIDGTVLIISGAPQHPWFQMLGAPHSRPAGPATWNRSFQGLRLLLTSVTVRLLLSACGFFRCSSPASHVELGMEISPLPCYARRIGPQSPL